MAVHRLALGTAVAALAILAGPAYAQPVCGPTHEVMRNLAEKYQEVQSHLGLSADGVLIGVTVSASGKWTLLMHQPNGVTCLLAHGESWQNAGPSRPFPGAPKPGRDS